MLTIKDIPTILLNEYGINSGEVRQLYGYVDKNFWIKDADNGNEYVLRATRDDNFCGEETSMKIDDVLDYLSKNSFRICHPIRTLSGNKRFVCKFDNTPCRYVSLSAFIPGKTVAESKLSEIQLTETAADAGRLCALFHKCIYESDFANEQHYSETSDDKTAYVWFTANFCNLKSFTNYTPDNHIKEIIEIILDKFEKLIVPLIPNLRKGFVHGDFSNTNLVLIPNQTGSKNLSVKERLGIIDFEDAHRGAFVFDLSVCMAYMMTNQVDGEVDKLSIAGKILANYLQVFPLNDSEKAVLYYGVLARLSTSYVMSFYQISRNPENKDYYKLQSSKCPHLINLMWEKGEKNTLDHWMNIDC